MSKLTQIIDTFKENIKKIGSFAIFIPVFYFGLFSYPDRDYEGALLLVPRILAALASPISIILAVVALGLAGCAAMVLQLFLPFQCAYAKIYDACEPIDNVTFDGFTTTAAAPKPSPNEQQPMHYPSPLASGQSAPSQPQRTAEELTAEPERAGAQPTV